MPSKRYYGKKEYKLQEMYRDGKPVKGFRGTTIDKKGHKKPDRVPIGQMFVGEGFKNIHGKRKKVSYVNFGGKRIESSSKLSYDQMRDKYKDSEVTRNTLQLKHYRQENKRTIKSRRFKKPVVLVDQKSGKRYKVSEGVFAPQIKHPPKLKYQGIGGDYYYAIVHIQVWKNKKNKGKFWGSSRSFSRSEQTEDAFNDAIASALSNAKVSQPDRIVMLDSYINQVKNKRK